MKINFEQLNREADLINKRISDIFQPQYSQPSHNCSNIGRFSNVQTQHRKKPQRFSDLNNVYDKIRGSLDEYTKFVQNQSSSKATFHKLQRHTEDKSSKNQNLIQVIKHKRKKPDINQLSINLGKAKKQPCDRKNCKKLVQRQYQRRIEEYLQGTQQNFIPNINNSKLDKDRHQIYYSTESIQEIIPCLFKDRSKPILQSFKMQHKNKIKKMINVHLGQGKVHEKLYNQSKKRQFTRLQSSLSTQKQRKMESHPTIYGNPEYLTKYVNFFDRLEHEVSKKAIKTKYYNSVANLQSLDPNEFKPNLEKSKKSFKMGSSIKPNYQISKNLNRSVEVKPHKQVILKKIAQQKKNHRNKNYAKGLNNTFAQTLNSSFDSLDLSFSLMRGNQQRFIQRIGRKLSQRGVFTMNGQKISSLTDKQFAILIPLLQRMEVFDGNVTVYKFQDELRRYLDGLSIMQKQDIRHQQIRLQRKSVEKDKLDHTQDQQISQSIKNLTKKKLQKRYYQKLENFV